MDFNEEKKIKNRKIYTRPLNYICSSWLIFVLCRELALGSCALFMRLIYNRLEVLTNYIYSNLSTFYFNRIHTMN